MSKLFQRPHHLSLTQSKTIHRKMDTKTFQKFREIVYSNSGINLSSSKEAMVSSRVSKRMRELGITEPHHYLHYLLKDDSGDEIIKFLDVISTNVTSFYREQEHFEFLAEVASQWIHNGQSSVRIWCAAASTGEEPYTIAMSLLSAAGDKDVDIKILATDISTRALAKAQTGKYSSATMTAVPKHYRKKYFFVHKEGDQTFYIAKDVLKSIIVFRRLNLSKPPFPMKGPLDTVFCRNVMIYFDNQTRAKLIAEIDHLLKTEGYLITGHAESLTSIQTNLQCVRPSVYQKR